MIFLKNYRIYLSKIGVGVYIERGVTDPITNLIEFDFYRILTISSTIAFDSSSFIDIMYPCNL